MAWPARRTSARRALAARIKVGGRFVNEDAIQSPPLPSEATTAMQAVCPSCGWRHSGGLYASSCDCGQMDQCMDCYRCNQCDYPLRKVEDPT